MESLKDPISLEFNHQPGCSTLRVINEQGQSVMISVPPENMEFISDALVSAAMTMDTAIYPDPWEVKSTLLVG